MEGDELEHDLLVQKSMSFVDTAILQSSTFRIEHSMPSAAHHCTVVYLGFRTTTNALRLSDTTGVLLHQQISAELISEEDLGATWTRPASASLNIL